MANYNLTNQPISSSFQQLLQKDVTTGTLYDGTGSVVSELDITSSYAISSSHATTASFAENGGVTSIIAGTNITIDQSKGDVTISSTGGGGATDTGSLLVTASNDFSQITFTKGDGSTFLIDSTPRRVVETVKNKNGFMPKGTPVYVSGSTGNELHVYQADAGNILRVPATFVLDQDLNTDESGIGILSGFINGVDTSLFAEGANIYLAVGGGYTDEQPTGSAYIQKLGNVINSAVNGSGVIVGAGRVNALPNLTSGNAWVGDSNGVPQQVSTSSWDAHTDITQLNQFTASADIRLDNIELTTASLQTEVDGLSSLTGSYARTDITNVFTQPQVINGGQLTQIFNAPTTNQEISFANVSGASVNGRSYNRVFYGMADYPSAGTQFEDYFAIEYYNTTGVTYNFGSEFNLNGSTAVIQTKASGSGNISKVQTKDNYDGNSIVNLTSPHQVVISTPETVMSGNLILVGNLISPTGTTTIANNTVVSGSTATEVKPQTITSTTASIDFSSTSMFELTLGSGVDTHIDATNVGKGQTINLLITQDASTAGTVSFSPKFLQPSGSEYTPTTTLGGKDILTLVTFSDTNSVYVAAVNEMI